MGGGDSLASAGRAVSAGISIMAQIDEQPDQLASKKAMYERRADEWLLQYKVTARELMHIGRQILGSLIAEAAYHEYVNVQKQIEHSQETDNCCSCSFNAQ
jgi:hypothetical protein